MKLINDELLSPLINEAKSNGRKRKNYNFHPRLDDVIQRMLNAMEPGTYVRPHRHSDPAKREVFIVLKGQLAVLFFDDKGNVLRHVVLDPMAGVYGVEVEVAEWHAIVPLVSGSVVYELKDGPYEPLNDKDFASWAPAEGHEGCDAYLNNLLDKLGLRPEMG